MLRRSIERGELTDSKDGLGPLLGSAVALGTAASVSVGFFALRRASEVAELATSDVELGSDKDVAKI